MTNQTVITSIRTQVGFKSYLERMLRSAVRILSAGAFSVVYKSNSSQVKKVFKASDEGYKTYLFWAIENQHNPFVPRIYSLKFHEVVGLSKTEDSEGYYEVEMERLSPGNGTKKLTKVSEAFNLDEWQKAQVKDEFFCLSKLVLLQFYKGMLATDVFDLGAFLVKAKDQFTLDLHSGNFMFRGNQLVLTDPLAGGLPEFRVDTLLETLQAKIEFTY